MQAQKRSIMNSWHTDQSLAVRHACKQMNSLAAINRGIVIYEAVEGEREDSGEATFIEGEKVPFPRD